MSESMEEAMAVADATITEDPAEAVMDGTAKATRKKKKKSSSSKSSSKQRSSSNARHDDAHHHHHHHHHREDESTMNQNDYSHDPTTTRVEENMEQLHLHQHQQQKAADAFASVPSTSTAETVTGASSSSLSSAAVMKKKSKKKKHDKKRTSYPSSTEDNGTHQHGLAGVRGDDGNEYLDMHSEENELDAEDTKEESTKATDGTMGRPSRHSSSSRRKKKTGSRVLQVDADGVEVGIETISPASASPAPSEPVDELLANDVAVSDGQDRREDEREEEPKKTKKKKSKKDKSKSTRRKSVPKSDGHQNDKQGVADIVYDDSVGNDPGSLPTRQAVFEMNMDTIVPSTNAQLSRNKTPNLTPNPSFQSRASSTGTAESSTIPLHRAGSISPSQVCQQRRLSPVVKLSEESTHELADGRPTIVLPPPPDPSEKLHKRCASASVPRLSMRAPSLRRQDSCPTDGPPEYLSDPSPLRVDAWSEPSSESVQVRGPRYLKDRKKVPSEASAFQLLTVDVVKTKQPILTGLCAHPEERIQKALAREEQTGRKELPAFVFAVNLVVPGNSSCVHSVFYFGVDDKETIQDNTTPFGRVASKFFFGESDEFRNETFKLIPKIVDGNILVRKAVGSKPAILGKKIKQTYVRTDRYMEVIVDIASDRIAQNIVKLSIGYVSMEPNDVPVLRYDGVANKTLLLFCVFVFPFLFRFS